MSHPGEWEYLTIAAEDAGDLSALGREGWELAGVDDGKLYFKRSAVSFRERVTLDQKRHVYGTMRVPLPDGEGPKT
jgi:hypothetical protein